MTLSSLLHYLGYRPHKHSLQINILAGPEITQLMFWFLLPYLNPVTAQNETKSTDLIE